MDVEFLRIDTGQESANNVSTSDGSCLECFERWLVFVVVSRTTGERRGIIAHGGGMSMLTFQVQVNALKDS